MGIAIIFLLVWQKELKYSDYVLKFFCYYYFTK